MITLLLALATVQDTTIVIHPDSSSVSLEARALPRVVSDEVIAFYNAPGTTRLVGRTKLPSGNEWRGNVAVRNGPVLVGGRIQGTLVVINGDLVFDTGAEVTGDVIVVGGIVDDTTKARIGGEVRQYREPLLYRLRKDGDELVYAPNLRHRLWNPGAQVSWGTADSRSALTIATGGTFNRVEGLPVVFGPLFDWKLKRNFRMRIDALGVFRSAGDLSDKRSDLGYMFRGELRAGDVRSVGLGLRAFAQPERQIGLSLEVRREWQTSVANQDPWTVFRNSETWRPNPSIDEGHYTTIALGGVLDARNDPEEPTSGWLIRTSFEDSRSTDVVPNTGVPAGLRDAIPTGSYRFDRIFVDIRHYARISPGGRVNVRLAGGGWVGGDPLPLQRRLSLGGPDPMPGHPFRAAACNNTFTDPTLAQANVAACDRVISVQTEYRGHVKLNWSYNPSKDDKAERDEGGGGMAKFFWLEGLDVVVFADAGQAWLVGSGPGHVPADRMPSFSSWLVDAGLGVDWGGFGVYIAKAVTTGERLHLTVRIDHRF